MFRLDHRTALITGGSGALGSVIADLFSQAGARVVVAGRERIAGRHPSVAFDVTEDAEVAAGVAEARELLGGQIDILVNSAGTLSEATVVDMSPQRWKQTIAVDLTGVFLTCRHVVPEMIERRWGRIINVASQLAIKGGYSMSPDHPTMASLLRGAADATAQMGFFPWLSPLKNDYDEFFGHHTGAVDFTNRSRQVRSVGWGRGGIRRRVSDSISRAAPPSACCPK
jgi:NAD(P)-dependent dehydrogenase (short-subunit alcohol dehydrogenase family)